MAKFNDNYYDPPDEGEEPCKICHYPEGQCTCIECSCGEVGNPACVNVHLPWDQWPHFRFQLSEAETKAIKEREIMENIVEQDAWAAIDKAEKEETRTGKMFKAIPPEEPPLLFDDMEFPLCEHEGYNDERVCGHCGQLIDIGIDGPEELSPDDDELFHRLGRGNLE